MRAADAAPLVLGSLAVAAGAAFLWNVGALPGMASRNIASFLLGLLLGWSAHHVGHRRLGAELLFAAASAIFLLVLLRGIELDGVKRWLSIGPVQLQPALILGPLLLALVASREGRHWRVAILIPLLLVALQPDAATSVALAIGVAALMVDASSRSARGWSRRRIAIAVLSLSLATAGLLLAGIRTPPPVAFVEGTVGIAVLSGSLAIALHILAALLAVAALISRRNPAGLALAAYFAVSLVAAVFWAFPMPVLGAGPSHLIGFGLAVGWLTVGDAAASRTRFAPR